MIMKGFPQIEKNSVKAILGDRIYKQCYELFKKLLESSCRYKIIMTRRCFSLFKIFSVILKDDGISNAEGTFIITDKVVLLYVKEIKDALLSSTGVLAIDDIIIYGRTINALLDTVRSFLSKDDWKKVRDNIEVQCIVKNKDFSRIRDEYKSLVAGYVSSYGYDWRMWSVPLSTLVSSSGIANTSYVVSAFYEKSSVPSFSSLSFVKDLITPQISIQWALLGDTPNNITKHINCAFVRVYRYDAMYSVIPLVILRERSLEEMNDLCAIIIKNLSIKDSSSWFKILESEDENLQQIRMQLVTLILSHAVLQRFLKQYDCEYSLDVTDYDKILRCNFSERICNEFSDVEEKIIDLLSVKFEEVAYLKDQQDLDVKVLYASIKDTAACINSPNEKRTDFFSIADKCEEKYTYAISRLIDSGRASIRAEYSFENGFCSLMYSGEQAFMIGENLYADDLEGIRYADFLYGLSKLENLGKGKKKSFHLHILDTLIKEQVLDPSKKEEYAELLSKLDEGGQGLHFIVWDKSSNHPNPKFDSRVKLLIEKEVQAIGDLT